MIILHCLIVLLVSMLPVIELRGAIPIGVGLGVPEPLALIIAVIGNMIPVPFIYKFARKLLELGSQETVIKPLRKFCKLLMRKGERAGKKLMKKGGDGVYVALFFFVGIPIPGTGAWTGTLAASLLDLDYKKTVKSIVFGVLLSGCIMLAISLGIINIFS